MLRGLCLRLLNSVEHTIPILYSSSGGLIDWRGWPLSGGTHVRKSDTPPQTRQDAIPYTVRFMCITESFSKDTRSYTCLSLLLAHMRLRGTYLHMICVVEETKDGACRASLPCPHEDWIGFWDALHTGCASDHSAPGAATPGQIGVVSIDLPKIDRTARSWAMSEGLD
jgi:hypothetical protein